MVRLPIKIAADGKWEDVEDIQWAEYAKEKIQASNNEFLKERTLRCAFS